MARPESSLMAATALRIAAVTMCPQVPMEMVGRQKAAKRITGNGNTRISYINATDGVTVDFTSWVVGQGASGTAYGTAAGDLANVGTDTITGVNAVA